MACSVSMPCSVEQNLLIDRPHSRQLTHPAELHALRWDVYRCAENFRQLCTGESGVVPVDDKQREGAGKARHFKVLEPQTSQTLDCHCCDKSMFMHLWRITGFVDVMAIACLYGRPCSRPFS